MTYDVLRFDVLKDSWSIFLTIAGEWGNEFWTLEEIRRTVACNPCEIFYQKASDGSIRSFCLIQLADQSVELLFIFTSAGHRRLGLACALLDALEIWAKSQALAEILLEVGSQNRKAVSFYEKSGFTRFGLRPKYYKNSDDAVLMRKVLE